MDDSELIEQLQEKVREAEQLLRRRKEALAALKGKSANSRKEQEERGLRAGSVPALAQTALRAAKQHLTLHDLTEHLKKSNSSVDTRKVSIALSRYVREGKYFVQDEDGKYGLK